MELPENIFPVTEKSVSENKANKPKPLQHRDEERERQQALDAALPEVHSWIFKLCGP